MSNYQPGSSKARAFFTIGGFIAVIWMMNTDYSADAAPLACEHRSAEHAAQAHTTREGDSRWHVAHGQLPTCGLDDQKQEKHDESNDSDGHWRRDHEGFHCTWHGCG